MSNIDAIAVIDAHILELYTSMGGGNDRSTWVKIDELLERRLLRMQLPLN